MLDVLREMFGETKEAPPKPADGAPCNGCGDCCAHTICCLPDVFGLKNLPQDSPGPCPIMEHADGRWWCGFARSPEKYLTLKAGVDAAAAGAEIREWLGDGTCDSDAPAGTTAASIILGRRFQRMFR